MELPPRAAGDVLLRSGELIDIRRRLRNVAGKHDLVTVIACAFDHRTRMLPFAYSCTRMAPAGARAVGAAMADSGFEKTRIVLQQWNRNFRPSQMQLDGRVPDMFLVSSMQIHAERCEEMIRDAWRIPPDKRPLIIAGGPKMIYEPWDGFSAEANDPWGADVVVTGEEYVLLNLLEVLLSVRAPKEPMRSAFMRARDGGMLDEVPGLVYAQTDAAGVAEELVDTGIQRLVGDLDELPDAVLGYRMLEAPSRKPTLASRPLPAGRVRRYTPVGGMVLTSGCKFACPYCPIPAYHQRQRRFKSGPRIADEMTRIRREFGINFFFGADDNFFNDTERVTAIAETLAGREIDGRKFRHMIRWGTEATVHDTLRMKDHLRLVRGAGMRALWLGVEDMTATLVKKGQTVEKTREALSLLRKVGISPMAMMMHHDSQPLLTRRGDYGLLNQVKLLRQMGAADMQVLMITPAPGSRQYENAFTLGLMYESVGGRRVEPHMLDGNFVVASDHPEPWRKQLNILAAYLFFYNPIRLLLALVRPVSPLYLLDACMQVTGAMGLVMTIRRTFAWALRLMVGKIRRMRRPPISRIPMKSPDGSDAPHDPSAEWARQYRTVSRPPGKKSASTATIEKLRASAPAPPA